VTSSELQPLYVGVCSAGLAIVGLWHLVAGSATERIFHEPGPVRLVGAALLALALPCLLWLDRIYFDVMGVVLAASGAMRLLTPGLNIRVQKGLYPRWVHGWIMLTGGVVSWLLYRWLVP
jgi:hypothetical protein